MNIKGIDFSSSDFPIFILLYKTSKDGEQYQQHIETFSKYEFMMRSKFKTLEWARAMKWEIDDMYWIRTNLNEHANIPDDSMVFGSCNNDL